MRKKFNELDIFSSALLIIIGILFVAIPYKNLEKFLFVILGLVIICTNLPVCIYYLMLSETDRRMLPYFLGTFVSIIIGAVFIFYSELAMVIVVAVWLIVSPLLRLITEKGKFKENLKKELPYIIIGVLLCFMTTPFQDVTYIVFKVFGGLMIAYGVIDLGLSILYIYRGKNGNNSGQGPNNGKPTDYIDVDVKEV